MFLIMYYHDSVTEHGTCSTELLFKYFSRCGLFKDFRSCYALSSIYNDNNIGISMMLHIHNALKIMTYWILIKTCPNLRF